MVEVDDEAKEKGRKNGAPTDAPTFKPRFSFRFTKKSLTMSSGSQRANTLLSKLFDQSTFSRWLNATFPQMGNFLRSNFGWNGTIVVVNMVAILCYKSGLIKIQRS
jgi:hypothetical protein